MLTLWTPRNGLFRFNPFFDDLWSWGRDNGGPRSFSPAVDIDEDETKFTIRADLPGVKEEDIEVTVNEGTLVLSGKREETKEEETDGGYYRERSYGSFCRTFRLGTSVDRNGIEANYEGGVLSVVLPKKEELKPRQIPVKATS